MSPPLKWRCNSNFIWWTRSV